MTVAIVGAGAIGGLLGARLARAGEDVILIARGAHLRALHAHGITVRGRDEDIRVELAATDDLSAIHRADVVFLTLKSHAIPGLAPMIGDLLKHDALVVGAMNGIPWWYFRDRHLEFVDPGGVIAGSIPYEQVIGSVVYPAATLVAPGVVEHEEGERFTLGEPDGSKSDRVQALARLLSAAGFKAPVQTRIRNEIWLKVVGNATLNPLSAITRATMGEISPPRTAGGSSRPSCKRSPASRVPTTSSFRSALKNGWKGRPRWADTRPRCCKILRRANASRRMRS